MERDGSVHEMEALLPEDEIPRSPVEEDTEANGLLSDSRTSKADASDSLAEFYEPVESYEGRHRFDPQYKWTEHEEKVVVRKVIY